LPVMAFYILAGEEQGVDKKVMAGANPKEIFEKIEAENAAILKKAGKCEKCGRPFEIKSGRWGKFLACTGYPECKNIKKIEKK